MTFETLADRIGEVIGTSDWFVVDQSRIDQFAATTEDHQFIHTDPERAKNTPFGGTIAHGFLTLSLLSAMSESAGIGVGTDVQMSVNYGLDNLRFLAPVRSGKRVRAHFKLLALTERQPAQWQQVVEATVEIEGEDKPALIAEWVFLHFV